MPSTDRRMIAPLLVPFFPTMADTDEHEFTSDEWHGFLNAQTGLAIELDEPNTTAFDKWRQVLATQVNGGEAIWPYTAARVAAIQARGEQLKQLEATRLEAQPATLATLAVFAPTKTPADLIKDAWKSFKI